jgi:TolA-binding protein
VRRLLLPLALPCLLGAAQDGVIELEEKAQPSATFSPSPYPSPSPSATQAATAQPTPDEAGKLLAMARASENLEEAAGLFRKARDLQPQGESGALAALELGKQEYMLGRYESANAAFSPDLEARLQGEAKGQLLFWRAQSRLALKAVSGAQDDFEAFLKLYPGHALADAARLSVADCDWAQGHAEAALKGYAELYEPPSSVAPQALLQASQILARQAKGPEARALLQKLLAAYPESLEASRAKEQLKSLPLAQPSPTPSAKAGGAYTVQVGAYVRRVGAYALFKKLKAKKYAVRLDKRVLSGGTFHVVQIGRYKDKAAAEAAAARLRRKEPLTRATTVVEIKP